MIPVSQIHLRRVVGWDIRSVVNASSANDVKLTVDFARENNVRLNVKASGNDCLKR